MATDELATGEDLRVDSDARLMVDVTVVMPAMNRGHLIARALDSVAAQTLRPRQVVVVDDASTDDTVDVARAHGADVIALPVNGGSGPARNRGIEAATTEWIAFLDSDDAWHPDHLATVVQNAEDHVLVASPGTSTGGRQLGNAHGKPFPLTSKTALVPGDLIITSGALVRRQALLDAGLFRGLRRAQDLDMWVRVLEHGTGVALTRPTVTYFLHDEQAIKDHELMRQCFGQIIDFSVTRPWFDEHDADRARSRWHWDDLRAAQRGRDPRRVLHEAGWLVTRPHTWSTLVELLRMRRLSRRAVRVS